MEMKDFLPLIGVALGWILSQLGQWFLGRREEKKAIARALADLLQIRHSLLVFSKAVESLLSHLSVPPEFQTGIKVVLMRLLPADGDLAKRYAESVSLVAACNPILGFRLRSQDDISPMLQRLREVAVADTNPASVAVMAKLERELLTHLNQHLDSLLKELASMHGFVTGWRVRRQLKRPLELPDGFLDTLKASLPVPPPKQTAAQAEPSDAP
jgi:hypothetical protein